MDGCDVVSIRIPTGCQDWDVTDLSQFIELCDIDPTRVVVGRSGSEPAWYMMRMRGVIDTGL